MSRPAIFNWTAADAAAVSALQTTAGAGSFLLNGTYNSLNINPTVKFPNFQRVVSLTSAANISGVQFTITGKLLGQVVTETRAGPNANTVATTQIYDEITSVTVDGAVATNTSVGTGQTGYTNWFSHDFERTVANVGIACVITGTITYSYDVTLDNVMDSSVTVTEFTPIATLSAATGNILGNLTTPVRFSRVNVSASTGAATLVETIIQQGLV